MISGQGIVRALTQLFKDKFHTLVLTGIEEIHVIKQGIKTFGDRQIFAMESQGHAWTAYFMVSLCLGLTFRPMTL